MRYGASERLRQLAGEHDRATSQAKRDRLARGIASESYAEERERERSRRNAMRRAHLADAVHLADAEDAGVRVEASDGGAGAEATIDRCDGLSPESRYARCVRNARRRLRSAHPEWLEVFDLVVRNGRDRNESIYRMTLPKKTGRTPGWAAAKTRYWDHLKKMLDFFQRRQDGEPPAGYLTSKWKVR